jgi:glycine oxidase
MLAAAKAAGVEMVASAARGISTGSDRVTGVELADGRRVSCDQVVLAAGCWSNRLTGIAPEALPPVRPVKGQIIRLRAPTEPPFLSRNVRCLVSGGQIYIVPRAGGEIVAGATVEELGFDTTVTAGAVYTLLRDAWAVLPAIAELELMETHAGLRPGTPDNFPILGPVVGVDGLVLATGHYRNGVLLTPVTAETIGELLATGQTPPEIKPFLAARFACA